MVREKGRIGYVSNREPRNYRNINRHYKWESPKVDLWIRRQLDWIGLDWCEIVRFPSIDLNTSQPSQIPLFIYFFKVKKEKMILKYKSKLVFKNYK